MQLLYSIAELDYQFSCLLFSFLASLAQPASILVLHFLFISPPPFSLALLVLVSGQQRRLAMVQQQEQPPFSTLIVG